MSQSTKKSGYPFFGDSFVYVIFDDNTDLYWARSRVLEYLSQVAGQLPDAAKPELGPDATGVGWVYSYALVDRTGQHDLSELRAIQDWFLKFELQTVSGVSEVASVGGMVKQYQVVVDPDRLRAANNIGIGKFCDLSTVGIVELLKKCPRWWRGQKVRSLVKNLLRSGQSRRHGEIARSFSKSKRSAQNRHGAGSALGPEPAPC